ncbi:MAG TPA: multiheme c-type cytochrome [Gemmataceae bacterium]|nr:multiheme c-type cytochrome [Gemmataceae bacterium]
MKARLRIASVALVVAVGGWSIVSALTRAAPVPRSPSTAPGDGHSTLGFAGTASCSARACHGGTEPLRDELAQRNEYTHTVLYDKHAQAFQVLRSKRAQRMAENLAATNPDGKKIDADKDVRCLACHTIPQFARENAPPEVVAMRSDGVGCEACHGPASGPKPWLTDHTVPSKWREKYQKNPEDPIWQEYGFTDLGDLRVQAAVCAGCHIGAPADEKKGIPARDLNHDLMAAGHPRLNFELSSFRQNMPPHWNVKLKNDIRAGKVTGKKDPYEKEKLTPGEYEAKVWAIGRVGSAKASLELLRHRASQAEKPGRWPEFAEYSCFACHGDLDQLWRTREAHKNRPVGSLPYDPWYGTLLPALSKATDGPPADELARAYDTLSEVMARPLPDKEDVDKKAEKIKLTSDWLDKLATRKYDPAQLLRSIAAGVKGVPPTWEEATQLVYAAAALKHGEILDFLQKGPGAKKPADLELIEDLLKALAFPRDAESPRGIDGPLPAQDDVKKKFRSFLDIIGK